MRADKWANPALLFQWLGRALRSAQFPDFWLFLIAGAVGWLSGVIVSVMSRLTQDLHMLLFQVALDDRLSSQDNLIACDIFEGTVPLAQAKIVPIACKLIGEP